LAVASLESVLQVWEVPGMKQEVIPNEDELRGTPGEKAGSVLVR